MYQTPNKVKQEFKGISKSLLMTKKRSVQLNIASKMLFLKDLKNRVLFDVFRH